MTPDEQEKAELDILKLEYARVCDAIHQINTSFLNMQSVPLSSLAVVAVVFVEARYPGSPVAVFICSLLPSFVLYLIYNVMKYTVAVMEHGGYAAFLEKRINDMCGAGVLLYESSIYKITQKTFYGGVAQALFGIPIIGGSLYVFADAARGNINFITAALAVITFLQLICLAYLIFLMIVTHKKVREGFSREYLMRKQPRL